MPKRTRRTPEDLIAAKTAEIERLQAQANQRAAKKSPDLQPLNDLLALIKKEEMIAKTNTGNGPFGIAARIRVHAAWIPELEELREMSEAQIQQVKSTRKTVNDLIDSLCKMGIPELAQVESMADKLLKHFNKRTQEHSEEYKELSALRKEAKKPLKSSENEESESN